MRRLVHRAIAEVRERVRALLFTGRENRELEEELRFHVDRQIEENLRSGLEPREARRQAYLRLGGRSRVREATRDARGVRWIQAVAQDARYGLRGIRKQPGFALTLVLTIGLGVGANAAMFGVVDALLLRPLPYGEPDGLVDVRTFDPESGSIGRYVTLEDAREWTDRQDVLDGAFQHQRGSVLYAGGDEPLSIPVQIVAPSFEEVLRVRPALGRGLEPADAGVGAEPVAVLNDGFWRSAFGADPEALGRVIELDGIRHRIVGVMPKGFKFPTYSHTEAWVALRSDGTGLGQELHRAELTARLRPEDTIETAQARADALAAALGETAPREAPWTVRLSSFSDWRNSAADRSLWFLTAAVGLILLVAILNAMNLLLVRGWSRTRELAARLALGASRTRVIGQLLTEGLVLSLAGGVAAVLFALTALRAMQGIMPPAITFYSPYTVGVEQRTLWFTFLVACTVGIVGGLLPALFATRIGVGALSPATSVHAARTPARSRLRRVIVVAEMAMSVALLVGAGLFINSFTRLVRVDPGFRLEDIAMLNLSLPASEYEDGESRMTFIRALEGRLEAIPGVVGVTTGGGGLPASTYVYGESVQAEGAPPTAGGLPAGGIPLAAVSPDFFDLFDVEILSGRRFGPADAGTDNAIVDVDLARHLWGEASPLGRRFRIGESGNWRTVVGVVGDLRLLGADDRLGDFEILHPAGSGAFSFATLAVRSSGPPEALFPALRDAVHGLSPRQPIADLRTAEAEYMDQIAMPRFLLVLMSMLAGLAIALSTVGIYGVLAYGVAQRRYELAVRIAVGATPPELSRKVLLEGLGLAAAGSTVGVAIALAFSGAIRTLLYGVSPTDPVTIGIVVLGSLAVAAFACWWPARRAGRIDPVRMLNVG
ncbi:MAG: ABC transporter permease [Gemmatimonadota bacterium]|nr:ABC transporter permease [Gemmatimonadota bacterium]